MQTRQLVEIFLPTSFGNGDLIPEAILELIRDELTEMFGGATVYTRAPAKGSWREGASVEHDSIVVVEVMTDGLDKKWWKDFRQRTEELLRQNELLIRVSEISLI